MVARCNACRDRSGRKKGGSELLLAWPVRPAAPPLDSVADNPVQGQKVLQLLTDKWAALSKMPRAREEAENAAMAAIGAACPAKRATSPISPAPLPHSPLLDARAEGHRRKAPGRVQGAPEKMKDPSGGTTGRVKSHMALGVDGRSRRI